MSERVAAQFGAGDVGDTRGGVMSGKAKPPRTKSAEAKSPKVKLRGKTVRGRSTGVADTSPVCPSCGQTFTRAANLAIHVARFGSGPHQRPVRRGAAAIADTTVQDAAQENDAAQEDAAQATAQGTALDAADAQQQVPTPRPPPPLVPSADQGS